jgi:putative DNA primase/helicase
METIADLVAAMEEEGLNIDQLPILDSKIHRVSTDGKKKSQDNRGWYTGIILGEKIFCTFGRWDGQKVKWNNVNGNGGNHSLTREEKDAIKLMKENAIREQQKQWDKTAIEARRMWEQAEKGDHPYLIEKKISSKGSAVLGSLLLIPIMYQNDLVNLQRIYPPNGKMKRFLDGGRIPGTFGALGGSKEKVYICEGFATASTVNEATGGMTFISFMAPRLPEVAQIAKDMNPDSEIVICGDNDPYAEKQGFHPGQHYAKLASDAISATCIIPPKEGDDFNDMMISDGIEAVRDYILSPPSEIQISETQPEPEATGISLHIPESLYQNQGLITLGLKALVNAGASDIIQYSLPAVLSVIARAIASKLSCQEIFPNIYNIKVGNSSTGKTDTDKFLHRGISRSGLAKFFGPTDFSSGPGLLRGLMECPQCLITLDEVVSLFRRHQNDITNAGKMAALLELYTKSGIGINKPYGDSSKNVNIDNPVVILLGNGTLNIFDDLKMEDMTSGMIQRFDFWVYDGKIPYRRIAADSNSEMNAFVSRIAEIFQSMAPQKNKHDLTGLMVNYPLSLDPDCMEKLNLYSRQIVDEANEVLDIEGAAGITSARYRLALKYAMIHMAADRPVEQLYDPMALKNLEWGIDVAKMLADWKMNVLIRQITTGDFHKECEVFKEAIKAAIRVNQSPSLSVLCGRRKQLNNLNPRQRQDVIDTLIDRGEIWVDTSKPKTPKYYLTK